MASELSRFIEQELERKGIDPDDDRRNLLGRESFRIESRSHAQETQRKASKTTRNFCVGGGIFLAMVLIVYFLSKSNAKTGHMVSEKILSEKNTSESPAPADNSSTAGDNGTEYKNETLQSDVSQTPSPSMPEAREDKSQKPAGAIQKTEERETEKKAEERETEKKAEERETEKKAEERETEKKAEERETEKKAEERETEKKAEERETEKKAEEQKKEKKAEEREKEKKAEEQKKEKKAEEKEKEKGEAEEKEKEKEKEKEENKRRHRRFLFSLV